MGRRLQRESSIRILTLLVLLMAAASPRMHAQPEARITYIHQQPGSPIRLHVQARCDGMPDYGLTTAAFRVYEIGPMDVRPSVLSNRPAADSRQPFDVMLAFDNSSFVPGEALLRFPDAGRRFVDALTGSGTEIRAGAITWNGSPRIREFLGTDLDAVRTALDGMDATGNSAVWDAAQAAITELRINGRSDNRFVVLAVTGRDNASRSRLPDVLQAVRVSGVRFVIVRVGADADSIALAELADRSGGFLLPVSTADTLPAVYDTLARHMLRSFDEYHLRYTSSIVTSVPQAATQVTVSVCGGTADDTVRYMHESSVSGIGASRARPVEPRLGSVHPHPAHTEATVELELPSAVYVRLGIFDALGRRVITLLEARIEAGRHSVAIPVHTLPPGAYHCLLQAGGVVRSRMLIVR